MPKFVENAHTTYSSQIEIHKRKGVICCLLSLVPYALYLVPYALSLEPCALNPAMEIHY
jgi:hypothetical protein